MKGSIEYYIYDGETCNKGNKKGTKELLQISSNSFKQEYKDGESILIIEKLGRNIITATLKNVSENIGVIDEWEDQDYGQAIFSEEKGDYIIEYGRPRIFRVFKNDYEEGTI
jgi:hypothetical protein